VAQTTLVDVAGDSESGEPDRDGVDSTEATRSGVANPRWVFIHTR